jgi:hypothetical protein
MSGSVWLTTTSTTNSNKPNKLVGTYLDDFLHVYGRIYISGTGTLTAAGQITGASFNATSDYRIKSNVRELGTEYNVDNIRPVFFHNDITNKDDIGVIAHELQEHFPFLVDGVKDDVNYQTVNYIGIIGILVNEIKQLKKEVEKNRKDIALLTDNIE